MQIEVLVWVIVLPFVIYRAGLLRGKRQEKKRIYEALKTKYSHMSLGTFNACVGDYEDLLAAKKLKRPGGWKQWIKKVYNTK